MAIFKNSDLHDAVVLAKALGDEARLRALCALSLEELCVCQLVELLGLAQSTVSKHMSLLHQAGLVACRKRGRWLHYRLADGDAASAIRSALAWVHGTLAEDETIAADVARVRRLVAEHAAAQRDQCVKRAVVRRPGGGRRASRSGAREHVGDTPRLCPVADPEAG